MKAIVSIVTSIILSATVTAVLGEHGLTLYQECGHNQECKSQHCVSLCADLSKGGSKAETSFCMEADWFYKRHGLSIPCITHRDLQRKMQFSNEHLLGETCHNDGNCMTKHCVPECASGDSGLWKCIEPKVFYARNNIQPPKCITKETIKVLNELKVPAASRNLGETCAGHLNCVSGHCVACCEDPQKESRCIEPRWSFTMYDLPVPVCVDTNTTNSLLQLTGYNGANGFTDFLSGRQAGQNTVHSLLDRNKIKVIGGFASARETNAVPIKSENKVKQVDTKVVQKKDLNVRENVQAAPKKGELRSNPAVKQSTKGKENNVVKEVINLRKDATADNVQSVNDKMHTVEDAYQQVKKNKEAGEKKITVLQQRSKENAQGDLEAKKAEEEALEKLRQIDIKVMQLQDDAMKKRRSQDESNSGEKKSVSSFVLWMHAVHMYFAAVFSLFKF